MGIFSISHASRSKACSRCIYNLTSQLCPTLPCGQQISKLYWSLWPFKSDLFFFSPPYCILPPPIFLPPSSLPSLFSSFLLSSLNYWEHWAKMGFWYHCNSPDPGQLIGLSLVDSFHMPLSLPYSQLSHPCFEKHKWMLCLGQDILFYFLLTVKWTACSLLTAMWTAEYGPLLCCRIKL